MTRSHRAALLALPALAAMLGCSDYSSDSHYTYFNTNAALLTDLDGDGRADFVAASGVYKDGSSRAGFLSLRLQNAAGALSYPPVRLGTGAGPANLAAGDLNGDGLPDIAVANADSGTVSIFFQDAATPGTFTPGPVLATAGRTPLDVAIGDLDGDGRMDVAVAASGANEALVFYQVTTTAGSFSAATPVAVDGDPQAVAIGDLDGDGKMDLAVATANNMVSVRFQAGALATGPDLATGQQPVAVKVVDLDGDGRMDILATNYGAASSPDTMGLSVILQTTTAGAFSAAASYDVGDRRSVALAVGDLDGDGRMDVVVANYGLPGNPGSVAVLIQDAAAPGTLMAAQMYGASVGPLSVAVGDVDGDGRLDIVVADGEPVVRFQSATQAGTFLTPTGLYY
ncbi:MAG TPA: VCBS repeat-containing protein [Holophagaceae bacterium]|nr:VCBS repeat-containing protein [Holophagaceae bacterium]